MDASNYDDITVIPVQLEPDLDMWIKQRAKKVLDTRKVSVLDREGKKNGGKECKVECTFSRACGVDVEDGKTASGRGNKGTTLDASADLYIEIKEKLTELKATQDFVKEDLKRELKKRKTNEITVGGIEVKLTETAGRTSLDQKAAKKAGIDLSPFESVGAPGERLDVNRVT
jgi:hypothetical protein